LLHQNEISTIFYLITRKKLCHIFLHFRYLSFQAKTVSETFKFIKKGIFCNFTNRIHLRIKNKFWHIIPENINWLSSNKKAATGLASIHKLTPRPAALATTHKLAI